jgi:hypothetical protein
VHPGIHLLPFGEPGGISGSKSSYIYSSFGKVFLKGHVMSGYPV